jgi:hypothetical protein
MKGQSKVKPYYLLGPSHPHLIKMQHLIFTFTMEDKINFLLAL